MKCITCFLALAFTSLTCTGQEKAPNSELPGWIEGTRSLRSLMRSDPYRPLYHFVAPEGHAMPFDPNGGIYWKGKYHLGYIYQKSRNGKDESVWGHAVSTDLLHWTLYPDMLDVKDGDREEGIYSGGAFLSKEGVPHIIYYGVGAAANLIAYSTDDDLKVWKKFDGNPVLQDLGSKNPFSTSAKYSVFDPVAWYDKKVDSYYQISGGMKPALFKSKDMYRWKYLGDLIDPKNTQRNANEDLSCPDFFSLGEKSMLLFISHTWGAQYYIGTFGNDKFSVEQHGRMNWPGGSFFAPEQLQDDKGRNIIWGWVVERKPPHLPDYGWSGIMSLPRVLSLGADDVLQIEPPKEIESLRLNEITEKEITLRPNTEHTLTPRGRSLELKLEVSGATTAPVGIKVFASPDGREETVITYDPRQKQLIVNFAKSSVRGPVSIKSSILAALAPEFAKGAEVTGFSEEVSEQKAPLELKPGEPLKLNIFIDRSVVEIFANGRQCVTQVVYPELQSSTALKVFTGNDAVQVKNIQSWTMAQTNAF